MADNVEIILDESGSEDDSIVIVARPQQQQQQQRRRRRGGGSAAASVIDLTAAPPAPARAAARNTAASAAAAAVEDDIQFVGLSRSGGGLENQLAHCRASAADSYVHFVGTKRSGAPPAATAAAAAGPIDRFDFHRFNVGGSSEFDGVNIAFEEWARHGPSSSSYSFSPTPTKKRQSKKKQRSSVSPPPPLPMEEGKSTAMALSGFDAVDMHYPHLKAADRTTVLHQLLPKGQRTKKWTHDWRVSFEKDHQKPTLWNMASALSDEVTGTSTTGGANTDDGDQKMPAQEKGGNAMQLGKENQTPGFPHSSDDHDHDQKSKAATPSIGPLSGKVLNTLHAYFRAHVGRIHHKAKLDSIEPVDEKSPIGGSGALTCSVCSDDFEPSDVVPCSGENELHFFCKPCFVSYATVTVQAGPIQSIVCPIPGCGSLFATAAATSNLCAWDRLLIEQRETRRDRRVALAAKAVLHCACGAVAVITAEDVGNGRIACPGPDCGRRYCCKCGNDDHGTEPCPPPAATVQWLDEHSKECPNCKNRIQKNGGCDHMTCAISAGGCGFEFWWTCGCPVKGQHKPGCNRLGERLLR